MQLRVLTLAIACCHASKAPVHATFRSIPIALPPLGEPVHLRKKGSYETKLVHQWPPVQFDRWTPIEYYHPYGYVYLNEEDGREYIFDSHATRPVFRTDEHLDTLVKADDNFLRINKITDLDTSIVDGVVEEIIEPVTPGIHAAKDVFKNAKLRGVVDQVENFTNFPANIMKDAIYQGKALLGRDFIGKDLFFYNPDVYRDCLATGDCDEIPDTWVAYITACQEKANSLARAFYEILTPLRNGGGLEEDFYDDEMWANFGQAVIDRIEAGRKVLIAEVETLPNIVDKAALLRLLVEPLNYFQYELTEKADPLSPKNLEKDDFYAKGINKINKTSAKFEGMVSNAVDQLIRFPNHIINKVKLQTRALPIIYEGQGKEEQTGAKERPERQPSINPLETLNIIPQLTGVVPSFFKPVLGSIF